MRFISAAGLGDDVSVITHVVARHGGAVLWRHSVQSLPSDGTPAVVHATLLAETVLVGAPSGADEALFGPAAGGPDTAGLLPPCSQGSWFTGAQGQGIAGVGGDFVRSETVFSDDLDAFGRLSSVRCLGPPAETRAKCTLSRPSESRLAASLGAPCGPCVGFAQEV